MTGVDTDLAARVWERMRALVTDRDWKQRVADELGLPFSRARALWRLLDEPLTLRELATSLATDAPYATVIVDDLERSGWVKRRVHPDDRRSKLVVLTPTGREAAHRATAIMNTPPPALQAVAPEDLLVLDRVLTVVAAGIEKS